MSPRTAAPRTERWKSARGRPRLDRVRSVAAIVTASALIGCSYIVVNIPARNPLASAPAEFLAGAARVDLTPTPGVPMGGFSGAGKISRGVWARLYARAIYLQDESGTPLVLVSCDLLQMPTGLADRVAESLSDDPATAHIGREQLVLAATHTHHGPAGFFSSMLNTSMTSPSPVEGFDRDLFDFLARRIVQAITEAEQNKQRARLRVNYASGGDDKDNVAVDLFRNRSVDAFLLNRDAGSFLDEREKLNLGANPVDLSGCTLDKDQKEFPNPLACLAIEPSVETLTVVEHGDPSRVIGVAGFLATHPTVLTSQMEVYSPDLFGVTSILLEQRLHSPADCLGSGDGPVVALFNGAQGDVSPTWVRRDRAEILDRSKTLAEKVCTLLPGEDISPVKITFQFDVVDSLTSQEFEETSPYELPTAGGTYERSTTSSPQPGEPELGGAEDGRTSFYHAGFREGLRAKNRSEHGAKMPALGGIGDIAFFFSPPPRRAPLGVYRIGPIALVGVPGEFTTMMGNRIRTQVSDHMGGDDPPKRVLLAGLANGHVSYVSTPEEYDAQHFEGASNFYGAATGPFVAHQLESLAAKLPTSTEPDSAHRVYRAWSPRRFGPTDVGSPPYWVDDGLSQLTRDTSSPWHPRRNFPAFCWYDSIPAHDELIDAGGDCRHANPEVGVARLSDGEVVADHEGLDLITVMTDAAGKRTEWCAIWLTPESLQEDASDYRFFVKRIRGADIVSEPLTPAAIFDPNDPKSFLDRRSDAPLPSSLFTLECREVPPFP